MRRSIRFLVGAAVIAASASPLVDCGEMRPQDDLSDSSRWSTFDARDGLNVQNGFSGAAFDGRFIYFAPFVKSVGGSGVVPEIVRYDVTGVFESGASWATFDARNVDPSQEIGYEGAVFDGRYVYFLPRTSCNGSCKGDGVVARYDTQGTFTATSSWSTFDARALGKSSSIGEYGPLGFSGGVFDGRYVYLVPANGEWPALRYDSQRAFADAASWEAHILEASIVSGHAGAAFDGRYVYFASLAAGGERYDTEGSFTASSSWSTWDLGWFYGGRKWGAFDGRFVYFAVGRDVIRQDTQIGTSSWRSFALLGNGERPDAGGTAFDGRYLYLAGPPVTRYDTHADFVSASSWSTGSTSRNVNFAGAVFDGTYVYFVPLDSGIFFRFAARSAPSMPELPGWSGSFY